MFSYIADKIKKAFADENANAVKLNHDPFEGHRPTDKRDKSRFFETNLGSEEADGNYEELLPVEAEFRFSPAKETKDLRIYRGTFIPTTAEITEEYFGHEHTSRVKLENAEPMKIGEESITGQGRSCGDGGIYIKNIHGSLQPCTYNKNDGPNIYSGEYKDTTVVTVVLTKEPVGWTLASAYPGDPGNDADAWFREHGYADGDYIGEVSTLPEWITEHVVHL